MRTTLFCLIAAVFIGAANAQDTDPGTPEVTAVEQVAKLIAAGLPDEAAKALSVAELEDAEKTKLRSQILMAFLRKGDFAAATEMSKADVEANLEDSPESALTSFRMLAAYAPRAGKLDMALEVADRLIARFARDTVDGEYSDALANEYRAAAFKSNLLLQADDKDAADELNSKYLARAKSLLNENPESQEVILLTIDALTTSTQMAEGDERNALFDEANTLLLVELGKDEIETSLVQKYASLIQGEAASVYSDNPERAETLLVAARENLAKAVEKNAKLEKLAKQYERTFSSLEPRIESARVLAKLVGSTAPPIDAAVWVNGEGMSTDSLDGKVVLLDFWAVWCGPCIATFPHLKEWNEEFGPQGLQIVGVTRKYDYAWSDEAGRASKAEEENTVEQEVEMLEKFLAHHELGHPSIITPEESTMQKEYAVSGIPHAVLIDRKGKVRMIKVGSGEANAKALHDMIVELLAE